MRAHLLLLSLVLLTHSPARAQPGVVQALDPSLRVLPLEGLEQVDEDALLGPGRAPAIVAVADRAGRYHPGREPLLVLHGIRADFGDVAPMIRRLAAQTRYQVHLLAYSDTCRLTSWNGDDLARLLTARFAGRDLTLVAHSLGGIVARRALNHLALEGGLDLFPRVRVIAVDVPWHGYSGPGDGLRMRLARPFMPDGYEDMRARSAMFLGLYEPELPAHVSILMVAARQGDQALDYRELPQVPVEIARRLRGEPFEPGLDPRVRHAASAILQSEVGERLRRDGLRTPAEVSQALERRLLRLPGDHATVLASDAFQRLLERFIGVDRP